MNIEEMVPELFEELHEKRIYYCQRCLNHGLRIKRKNHKLDCIYRNCSCSDCQMVDRRRELNSKLMQIDGAVSTPSGLAKGKERRPNCQRCAQHNVQNRLKGHKRACPFRECPCAKCQVVVERQKLMADQIKLRRRQKKQKIDLSNRLLEANVAGAPSSPTDGEQDHPQQSSSAGLHEEHPPLPAPFNVGGSQLNYGQLLSLMAPCALVDPMTTLNAILALSRGIASP
ncbi:hypothetical protein QR680_005667 [Steinernema hermaphroditum]|uniref:DM domain-containing protein n=1 Tax=Steinernema hermaphroditum TaxID=289476 RepID=A0AA39HSX4_9BILA|nr:hypothetical protein QR680_005667 [Steinernema hermaphroditum]